MGGVNSILFVGAILLSGCTGLKPSVYETRQVSPIDVEAPKDGKILVIFVAGPIERKGQYWFPQGSTLASVLDFAGLYLPALPHSVWVAEADGRAIRCRVHKGWRKQLDAVTINHGTRITVPYDRCFGEAPKPPPAANPAVTLIANSWSQRRGVAEAGR